MYKGDSGAFPLVLKFTSTGAWFKIWAKDVAIEGADMVSSLALSPPGPVDLWISTDNRDFFTSSTERCGMEEV